MDRDTSQRRAISTALREAGQPMTPQEILKAAKKHAPRLGIATVYRTLKGLLEESGLVPVELPGQAPRYELGDKSHHHHFSCRGCRKIFEIEACSDALKKLTPRGFILQDHDVILYGYCPQCARAKR